MTDHDPIDELLDGLRTDVPEMSDKAFAVGRARLQTLVAPAPVTSAPEQIQKVTPLRKRRLLRSPPGKLIATAAAAVVLAVGVVAGQAVWSGDNAPTASAAEQLNAAADKIEPTDEPLEPGQYRYTATHTWEYHAPDTSEGRLVYLAETVVEVWMPADPTQGCERRFHRTVNHKWLVGDEEKAKAAGLEFSELRTQDKVPCGSEWTGEPDGSVMFPLPRDPQKLYDWLRRGDVQNDVDVVNIAGGLLATGLPADARGAMYRALALVPGLEITEQVANVDDYKGTAYGLSQDGVRHDVIIDPSTGQFIGERRVVETGNYRGIEIPAGSVIAYTSVSNPTVVNEIGATR